MQGFAEVVTFAAIGELLHSIPVHGFPPFVRHLYTTTGASEVLERACIGRSLDLARLTWLSVRCLSSCLFSASS
jgi:hypothetical protein